MTPEEACSGHGRLVWQSRSGRRAICYDRTPRDRESEVEITVYTIFGSVQGYTVAIPTDALPAIAAAMIEVEREPAIDRKAVWASIERLEVASFNRGWLTALASDDEIDKALIAQDEVAADILRLLGMSAEDAI